MVVEDFDIVRKLMKSALGSLGYVVDAVSNKFDLLGRLKMEKKL